VTTTPRHLGGGGRFSLTVADGMVTKRGDARVLAREAAGLRVATAADVGPTLVSATRGAITTTLIPGRVRPSARWTTTQCHALGALLRRLHDSRRARSGGRSEWTSPVHSLSAYRARRLGDALSAARSARDRAAVERVAASLPPMTPPGDASPFRMLHGDLVATNILWTPAPRLVDFEFWRVGDPAEDLAYLIELNRLGPRRATGVCDGYDEPSVTTRIPAWRALCVVDAALWYQAHGDVPRYATLLERAADLARV
jgi:Ser/Thr protein kinase RdoA (MazF antagonist)